MNVVLFFVGAMLIFAAWGALVLLGKADAREYVLALGAALSWMATHQTAKSAAISESGASPAIDAVPPAPRAGYTPTVADGAPMPPPPASQAIASSNVTPPTIQ
ncbi:hypothetical protein G3N59_01405 [Paraburkholderia sp. Ac-20340]|uniref:hypothetical protein n=1 Tax=Paraburkholderia sp. Ac-20340 TaxID=2703888 RepID=UPI00197EBC50|nr:hypothetical protein [Paraburkholderia sp. Ac-20340]MBN3852025.1 hypothetical protein [Paraburkholderia sp. Ac-20340]